MTTFESMLTALPTATETEAARAEHERLSGSQNALLSKIAAVEAEIARLAVVAETAPDMAGLVTLAEVESLARIEGRELPKGHAAQLAQARQAAIGTQLQQQEAAALLPTMQARLSDLRAEYQAARPVAIKAAQAYGDMKAAPLLRQYAAKVAEAFALESEIEAIGEDLGTGFYASLKVRHPTGGDWYDRRSLAAVEQASGL